MYMRNWSLVSNPLWAWLPTLFGLLILFAGCGKAQKSSVSSYETYCVKPYDSESESDVKWAAYLARHLENRSGHSGLVVNEFSKEHASLTVTVGVDNQLEKDYVWKRSADRCELFARTPEKMLWLLYQFISWLAESDVRIQAPDLPPAIISSDYSDGTFAFEYRGLYTPSNMDSEFMPITASHNVDYDWGLWGHNLYKLFPSGVPREVWAEVKGKPNADQFCFSSDKLYETVEHFVLDNYGEGNPDEPVRFALMPNDNDLVCTCSQCVRVGNSKSDATPAVTMFVRRIASRFPHHLFFTSSYETTQRLPRNRLPQNAGVIVSAMSLPMFADGRAKKTKRFSKLIEDWRKLTDRVYVWDYIRNFDDYFTPYPCLSVVQQRLRFYRDLGVRGVFFNGSGADYATFDDVQTSVIAALLVCPDIDVDAFVEKCWRRYYPVTGAVLHDFYEKAEDTVRKHKRALPLYGGIGQAVSVWLNPDEFEVFYCKLDSLSKEAKTEERSKLNQLLTALSFTRLELMRFNDSVYHTERINESLESLRGYTAFKNMSHYREANGELSDYIKAWETMKPWGQKPGNQLYGLPLKALSQLDTGYPDTKLLTDGKQGFSTDYHTGWLIVSADTLVLRLPARSVSNSGRISVSFLYAPRWRMVLPTSVELWQGGRCVGRASDELAGNETPFMRHTYVCDFRTTNPGAPVDLRVKRAKKGKATMACDEVELYSQ